MSISPGLQSLLAHTIDYAGLFPPARLPLAEAIANYNTSRAGPHAWMLSRFVCQPEHLAEITTQSLPLGRQIPVSLLAPRAETAGGVAGALRRSLQETLPPHAAIEVIDVYMTDDVQDRESMNSLAQRVEQTINRPEIQVFFEVPFDERWDERVEFTVGGLRLYNSGETGNVLPAGLKLRCGGVKPEAYPSVEEVAKVIDLVTAAGVPIKFTAGLHHPLRHDNERAGVMMHGFLNIYGATLLASHLRRDRTDIDRTDIERILRQERLEGDGLAITDAELEYRTATAALVIGPQDIAEVRSRLLTTFGSCSFEEPIADLQALGLLAR